MKVLCDVHIPMRLVLFLQKNLVEAQHVNNILNSYHTHDKDIAAYADENQLMLLLRILISETLTSYTELHRD